MSKKMLIDATHPEATRVVVLENGRLDELDVDTSTKKQIKGNIYLAKVIRVEPSLQAAFVDYGGNKHGFLAFGEIHPDYYQIPMADKEKLKEMMMAAEEEKQEELVAEVAPESEPIDTVDTPKDADQTSSETQEVSAQTTEEEEEPTVHPKTQLEVVSESETEDATPKRPAFFKKYRIQEVIRQGQVMLIQVVKEERGNKGAALTTYLSLAGRYSVLMPNNGKGGGVSRKITNAKERKAMREIVDSLPIPKGMSVIVRTAGAGKKKAEIKRDYDYLIKTWMNIRDETLESLAPKLIHQEGDIIKRSLRDGFTTDIEEILVEGDATFKSTKEFMKILMPSQVKKIKQYKGALPMFQEYQVENQLEAIHSNIVQLRSGGYIVIDQTEALVAVDVNSGRATRERDIEETALRTNLETCDELARQLKLRDLAGLIVIDFIDMDEPKNNAAVERRLKEALKKDRARIQVGKISGFGLMEMSRQRLHSSFLESSYKVCPHCGGKGVIRMVESCATRVLYLLEEAANKNKETTLIMSLPMDVASYVLNQKRGHLSNLEEKYHVVIQIMGDSTLEKNSDYRLERLRTDGSRAMVQVTHEQTNNNRQDKQQKQNNGSKKDDKKETKKVEEALVKVEGETVENPQDQEEKNNARRNRNRRRREWKKNKKLAREAARAEAVVAENIEQPAAGAIEPKQDHLPAVVEEAPKAIVPLTEEKFTVVEQGSIEEFEKIDAPKSAKRPRTPKNKEVKAKTASRAKKVETAKEAAEVFETQMPAVEKTDMPKGDQPVAEKPTRKKGGWWNKLVK